MAGEKVKTIDTEASCRNCAYLFMEKLFLNDKIESQTFSRLVFISKLRGNW